MGTEALAFTNFLLILQVGVGYGTQIQGLNDNGIDRPDTVSKEMIDLIQQNGLQNGGPMAMAEDFFNSANDNMIRLVPLPTHKESSADTTVEDYFRKSPIDPQFMYRSHSPELGPLETNEIERNPNSLLMRGTPLRSSNEKNENDRDLIKENTTVENKRFDSPELAKALEGMVNNLPSEEPLKNSLKPLIKLLIRKINETPAVEKKDPITSSLDRDFVMRLQRKLRQVQERNDVEAKNIMAQKSEVEDSKKIKDTQKGEENQNVEESPKVEKASQAENQNEANVELCDCEGECDEGAHQEKVEPETPICDEEMMQNQTEPEKGKVHEEAQKEYIGPENVECDEDMMKNQAEEEKVKMLEEKQKDKEDKAENDQESQSEDDKQAKKGHQKPLAHIVIMLRPESEDRKSEGNYPSTSFPILRNERITRPGGDPSLRHIFMRITRTSRPIDSYQNINGPAFPSITSNRNVDKYQNTSPFKVFGSDDEDSDIPNVNENLFNQILPRESLLLNALRNMAMKQMAAFNAIGERQENKLSPMPSFEESSNSPPLSQIIRIKLRTEPSSPQVPLHFPEEGSGYKIKHLEDFRGFPIFQQLQQSNSESESEPRDRVERVTEAQDDSFSNNFAQGQMGPSQEVPWFIKNILTNMKNAGQVGSEPQMLNKSAEDEENPALIRAMLAPFAL